MVEDVLHVFPSILIPRRPTPLLLAQGLNCRVTLLYMFAVHGSQEHIVQEYPQPRDPIVFRICYLQLITPVFLPLSIITHAQYKAWGCTEFSIDAILASEVFWNHNKQCKHTVFDTQMTMCVWESQKQWKLCTLSTCLVKLFSADEKTDLLCTAVGFLQWNCAQYQRILVLQGLWYDMILPFLVPSIFARTCVYHTTHFEFS